MEEKNIHAGHRKRVKERFHKEGLDNFDDVHVLELLLFYCDRQGDTNPLAHRLIERFGSVSKVLDAPESELKKIKGVSDNIAIFFSLVRQVGRYYYVNQTSDQTLLLTSNDCGEYLKSFFYGRRNETVFLLCLDAKCKVLCCNEVGEGSVNSASVPIRRIVEMALAANATTVVLAHNHPSGLAFPSGDDVQTTYRLARALSTVEIILHDHIVVSDNDFVSMAQSGLYRSCECIEDFNR